MDLTPKLLTEGTDFQQVRRGYDPDEVDDFLERVAAAVSRLQGQLVEANRRAEIAEASAGRTGGQPEAESAVLEEMQRTLILAQRTADAAVREAREEADSVLAAARREAATILTNGRQEADRYAAESRLSLATEVRELEQARDALHADLGALEVHVETQRKRLRAAVEELQRVVDDPDGFRIERPVGIDEPAPRIAEPVAEPPAPPAREPADVHREPDPFAAAGPGPAEIVSGHAAEDRDYAAPASRESEPETEAPHSAPSPFGPPPGAVQTMPSPPVVAALDTEPAEPATESAPESVIDLTHERALPEAQEEDAFLAELRKAMTDDEPLGPREEHPGVVRTIGEVPLGRQRGRFGRRR